MSILNALRGLISDLIDRLAERVAHTDVSKNHVVFTVEDHLNDITKDGGRALVAKIARSEVKNYLCYLSELCEMPYTSPEGFIQALRVTAFAIIHKPESDAKGMQDEDPNSQ